MQSKTESPKGYSVDEAIELLFDIDLSKRVYQSLRNGAKIQRADIYPPYELVR